MSIFSRNAKGSAAEKRDNKSERTGGKKTGIVSNASESSYEQEAENVTRSIMNNVNSSGTRYRDVVGSSDQPKYYSGGASNSSRATIMRKSSHGIDGQMPDDFGSRLSKAKGKGFGLTPATRNFMETAFSMDFSDVRIHTDDEAASMNQGINAKAFTYGTDIYFNNGEYSPGSETGQSLIAHEMTHVVQQRTGSPTIQRAEDKPLGERVTAFKQLVKSTAIQRLHANRASLLQWQMIMDKIITDYQLNVVGLAQQVGLAPYLEMQHERNPYMQEILSMQASGHARACTGCHLIVAAKNYETAHPFEARRWRSPNEIRQGKGRFEGLLPEFVHQETPVDKSLYDASAYKPPPDSVRGKLNALLPDPRKVPQHYEALKRIVEFLGPEGFQVLPGNIIDDLLDGDHQKVRNEIHENIDKRRADYLELIGKIERGDVEFKIFQPVIKDLAQMYPDKEVINAINEELEGDIWDTLHDIAVAALVAISLLLIIFPPTSPAGVALLGAAMATLAVDTLMRAPQMIATGQAYQLGTGADNVFTKEQQESGGFLVFMGSLSIVTAVIDIGVVMGQTVKFWQAANAMKAMNESTPALVTDMLATKGVQRLGPNVFAKDEYIITVLDDGRILVTHNSRPDLIIIMDGNKIRMYHTPGPNQEVSLVAEGQLGMIQGSSDNILAGATNPRQLACYPAPKQLGSGIPGETDFSNVIGDVFENANQGVTWSVTPDGIVFPQTPFKSMPVHSPDGIVPPGRFLADPKNPVPVVTGTMQPGFTPFDILPGNRPTTLSLNQVRRSTSSRYLQGSAAETNWAERSGGSTQQTYEMPGQLASRRVDVEEEALPGMVHNELKNYLRFSGNSGIPRNVPLTSRLRSELERDAILMHYYGGQPVWVFTNAPPSAELAAALREADIPYISFSDMIP